MGDPPAVISAPQLVLVVVGGVPVRLDDRADRRSVPVDRDIRDLLGVRVVGGTRRQRTFPVPAHSRRAMGRHQARQLVGPDVKHRRVEAEHARRFARPLPPCVEIGHEGLDSAADLFLSHATHRTSMCDFPLPKTPKPPAERTRQGVPGGSPGCVRRAPAARAHRPGSRTRPSSKRGRPAS